MSKGAPKEIHNLNCSSLSVLATRRHKSQRERKTINSVRLENIRIIHLQDVCRLIINPTYLQ